MTESIDKPSVIRIRSDHRLSGFSKYLRIEQYTGQTNRQATYWYLIPEDLVSKAVELGGKRDPGNPR